jgi:AraC family transcriptional regulator
VNHLVRVRQTPAVALEAFEHPPHTEHRDPAHEVAMGFCLNFVEGGSFRVRPERGEAVWRVTPEMLLVTTPGAVLSYHHDETHPTDRCTTIAYTDASVEQLSAARHTRLVAGVRPLTNRQQYLRQQLTSCACSDDVRFEALAGELFLTLTGPDAGGREPLFRAELLSWYAARVERARELIDADYHEPLSLTRLAREVGMSPFHFARVFRELVGVPPHRYLTGVRLTQATRRLEAGASVTDTCLAVGFGSLSHFVTAFRHRFGVTPSQWPHRRNKLG